jgi:ABC-type taurine transport system ATPase subunit
MYGARRWRARWRGSALPTRQEPGRANSPAGRRSGWRSRALVPQPEVLLLDEPFSALDAFTRRDLQDHLLDLWNDTRPTLVLVTHDVDEAVVLADRVLVMRPRPGRLFEAIKIT